LQVWDEHLEVTADLVLSHFVFSLPLDAPASFATHLVTLRWVLRFEFTTRRVFCFFFSLDACAPLTWDIYCSASGCCTLSSPAGALAPFSRCMCHP
jgi:hypothetical protein